MNTLKQLLYVAAAAALLFSCGKKQEPKEQETDLVSVSGRQFATDSMQLGEVQTMTFESAVKCSGALMPEPNGAATVNAPLPGIIKVLHCHNGQLVEKNQTLVEIGGTEVIDIQKDFAEAAANYRQLKNDYERIKSLYDEKVSAEKDFIAAGSAYKTALAKYTGLKMKIEALGLSATAVENGEFSRSYAIKSPIRGKISKLEAHIGNYVSPELSLFEITNPAMFHVHLQVFAADLPRVKAGQPVRFKLANSDTFYNAVIHSVGIAVDSETKTVDCCAEISDRNYGNPIANQYVEAEIITGTHSVNALPTDALLKTETGYFVLVLDKQQGDTYFFKKAEVGAGQQSKGYTELTGGEIEGKVLVKGVYNIAL